ncbi:cytochrome P450 [Streptomyces lydicus]|uniref:cytochrome P450 n=1 Tax=Streptomyces lydicus TaxID=47763 RepID=UPI0010106BE5|nr:cytochrome P450 [Streptomyces lydicus]MCZ1006263.1 cytochrome P450 [Streptomyces lydicus]
MTEYFDFTHPQLEGDYLEYYGRFRREDPVHWTPYGYWMLFKYDDADALLRSSDTSSDFPSNTHWASTRGGPTSPVMKSACHWMLMKDGDAHRRLRRGVGKLFTPRMLDQLRTRIPQIVNGLLDGIGPDGGEIDAMSALAVPLPVTVVSELMDIPPEDRDFFRSVTEPVGQMINRSIPPRDLIAMNKAEPKARAYLYKLIEKTRNEPPADTLVSLMLHSDEDYADEEVAANAALLYNAGYETTSNLIGNGLLALLQRPEALQALRDDLSLMPTAVEELSRFYPSARYVARILTEDMRFGDKVIPAGDAAFVAFESTGRDSERYPDPDRLDLGRRGVKSLAFSAGPHQCMGKHLALLEVGVLFSELLKRYSRIELAIDTPRYQPHFNLRTLKELPIRLYK